MGHGRPACAPYDLMKLLPLFLLAPVLALAQATFPTPVITSIYPLGGQPGKTVDLTVKGTDLDGFSGVHFSPDPGLPIEAKPKLDAKGQRVANTITLTLPAKVPSGIYELRAIGDFGISNPRVFQIHTLPMADSPGTNDKPDSAFKITPDSALHGVFKSAAPHWFEFTGKQGQRVFAAFDGAAFAMRTRLSGSLHDAAGRETARLRDGWLAATLPADGLYRLKVHDLMHGTGDDYAYRLTLTTGPVVYSSHHSPNDVSTTLHGWNLPGSETLPYLQVRLGPSLERLVTDTRTAEKMIAESPLPVFHLAAESEPAAANPEEPVSLSIGQTHTAWFPAQGAARLFDLAFKKDDRFIIEVVSSLHGLPTDPHLLIENLKKDAAGTETITPQAEINDMPGLAHAPAIMRVSLLDPAYAFEAKTDGVFRLSVSDPLHAANGRRHPYTLRVRSLDGPDTSASIAMHSTLPRAAATGPHEIGSANIWQGGIGVIEVALPLRGALSSAQEWQALKLSESLTFLGGFAGKGQRTAFLAYSASASAPASHARVSGLASTLHLNWSVRDTNRDFLFTRPGGPLVLGIVDQAAPCKIETAASFEVKAGEKIEIPLKAHRHSGCTDALVFKALGFGDPAKAPTITIPAKASEAKLVLDTKVLALTPGEYGFILQGPAKMPVRRNARQIAVAETEAQTSAAALIQAQKELVSAQAALKATPTDNLEAQKAAQELVKSASDKTAAAQKSKTEAEKTAKDLAAKNPPKDATFVIYSNPVRLRIQ